MKKLLVATDKPFAAVAVKGIREIVEGAGYELMLLEKYTDPADFVKAVETADAVIVRSDLVTPDVIRSGKNLKIVVRAGAGFDIKHQGVDPFGQLFAHDRSADQGWAVDRACDIPQFIYFLIRRGNLCCLPDHGATAVAKYAAEVGKGKLDIESGNGFQLVQRSTGMAKAAPADHGYRQPAGSSHWGNDERCFVSDAACRMLIHFPSRQFSESQHFSRIKHGFSEGGGFCPGHASKNYGHQPRRHLVIGDLVSGIAGDKEFDLLAGQFDSIPFSANNINRTHGSTCREQCP